MTTETTWKRALATTALIAAAGMALTGCSIINSLTGNTSRDDNGTVTENNDGADVFTIKVGDCFNDNSTGDSVEAVDIVTCDTPHTWQAYKSIIMDDGDYPGDTETQKQADDGCTAAFPDYVGHDLDTSDLTYSFYYPTQDSWDNISDREILCLVTRVDGADTTGTLENAGI